MSKQYNIDVKKKNILFENIRLFHLLLNYDFLSIFIITFCFLMIIPAAVIRSKLTLKEFDKKDFYISKTNIKQNRIKYKFLGKEYKFISYDEPKKVYKRYYIKTNFIGMRISDNVERIALTYEDAKIKRKEHQPATKYYAYILNTSSDTSNYLFTIKKGKKPNELLLWLDIFSFLNFCNIYIILFFIISSLITIFLYNRFILYHELRRKRGIVNSEYEEKRDLFLKRKDDKIIDRVNIFFCYFQIVLFFIV